MRAYRAIAQEHAAAQYHRSFMEWALTWPYQKEPKAAQPPVPDILKDD